MLICTVGVSGSGKTTWSKEYCKQNPEVVRLSSDELRAIYGEDESDQTVNYKVFSTLTAITEHLLKQNYSVLIDATNYSIKNRKGFVDIAKKLKHTTVAYVFTASLEICKQRNKLRERQVKDDIIDRQFQNFKPPVNGEFDRVWTIDSDGQIWIPVNEKFDHDVCLKY